MHVWYQILVSSRQAEGCVCIQYAVATNAANGCRAEPSAGGAEAEGSRKAQKTEPKPAGRPKSPQAGQGRAAGKGISKKTMGPQKKAVRKPVSRRKERPDSFKVSTPSSPCTPAMSSPQHPRLVQGDLSC